MSTKIKLEYPYNVEFVRGYLNTNKEPRRVLSLIREDKTRTSTSYARYLMSVHNKRFLKRTEHVDHIDNNCMNDVISNLQILTPKENNLKKNKVLGITLAPDIELTCPVCNKKFLKPSNKVKHKLKKGKTVCCSRVCGGIYSHRHRTHGVDR